MKSSACCFRQRLACWLSCAWAQPVVRLKAGAAGARPTGRRPGTDATTHFLLHFPTEPGPEMRRELERRGMRVLQYVPDAALMVASPAAPDLEGLGALSASALEASDKISPLLADQVAGALLVVFHPDAEMAAAREEVRARGFDVLENPAMLPGIWWSRARTARSPRWPRATTWPTSCPLRPNWRRAFRWRAAPEPPPRPGRWASTCW